MHYKSEINYNWIKILFRWFPMEMIIRKKNKVGDTNLIGKNTHGGP